MIRGMNIEDQKKRLAKEPGAVRISVACESGHSWCLGGRRSDGRPANNLAPHGYDRYVNRCNIPVNDESHRPDKIGSIFVKAVL